MKSDNKFEGMINFTVGPVMSDEDVLAIGAEQVPYFRTNDFSEIMLENEALMTKFVNGGEGSRAVFLTGSGTAAMESIVVNFFDERDKLLVVNGGSFGSRFVELCKLYGLEHTEIKKEMGKTLTAEDLAPHENGGYTGFLVNVDETSTGVYYDLDLISDFCTRNSIFLVVDAISSFLTDPLDMMKHNIAVTCTGSQKALACPPGVSIVVLSKQAVDRLEDYPSKCMYLDLKDALNNGVRGQTPFTPAVGTLRQIHKRLKNIEAAGGVEKEIERTASLAEYFRSKIVELPFEICSEKLSNAVTPLHPTTASANDIFLTLKDEYGIWVCPNGGDMRDTVFRVGHIGALTKEHYDKLIDALKDMQNRGLI